MKSLGICFSVLAFFVYVIMCSIMFLSFTRRKELINKKKIKELKKTFGREILQHLEMIKNGEEVPYEDTMKIKSDLKDSLHEQVFNETIILFNKDRANRKFTREYMQNYKKFINNLISKKNANDEKAYIAFLLGEYKFNTERIDEFLLECLKSNSLHLRFNALRSISKIGNVYSFINALNVLSENENNLNIKIVLDIIDEFGGNLDKLYLVMTNEFDTLNEKTKWIFIDHLTSKKRALMNEKLLSILYEKNVFSEIKSSIIKYFGVIKYERSKDALIKMLKEEIWECRALSAKSLENYSGEDVIYALMESIKDEDWYVRLNSARALLKHNISGEKIQYIINSEDKYASEIMQYALNLQRN